MELEWTRVSEKHIILEARVLAEIARLEWQDEILGGFVDVPAHQALALAEIMEKFNGQDWSTAWNGVIGNNGFYGIAFTKGEYRYTSYWLDIGASVTCIAWKKEEVDNG